MPLPKQNFKDKVVVITGAGAGLGRAVSIAFAKQGANVGIASRNRERLDELTEELQSYGSKTVVLPLDVANASEVERAAGVVEEKLGPIDLWVNNAMVSVFSPVKLMTPDEYKRVTDVTYLGVVYGTLAALKRMLPRDHGTIIQVGSALAYRGIPLQSAYCAAKHAIQGFHDSLVTELMHEKSKVRVTMIQFPALNTPQFDWSRSKMPNRAQPVPPIYQPEVAADAVLWAAEHYRHEYIVGFSSWKAIRGNSLFPSLADKYLARKGYRAQQTDEPKKVDQPDNLFEPAPGPYHAHGRFDRRAKKQSVFFLLAKHRIEIYLLLILMVIFLLVIRML